MLLPVCGMVLAWELAVRTALAFGTGTWVTEDDSVRQPSLRVSASRCVLALLPMIVPVAIVQGQMVDPATIEAGHPTVIASIEDPAVIGKILGHRASRELPAGSRPPSRGPPQGELGFP